MWNFFAVLGSNEQHYRVNTLRKCWRPFRKKLADKYGANAVAVQRPIGMALTFGDSGSMQRTTPTIES